jgi:nucleoside-diphosphate-sugar epimerase
MVSFNDKDRRKLNLVNIVGTAGIVNACLESGAKLCHVSSIASLGELSINEQVDEKIIWNRGSSASAYAISKYKSEMEVWRGIHEGLEAVIINPSVIIGPGMWMGPGKYLFSAVKKRLNFYPPGSSGYVDVRDVARIMILLCESGIAGERFIVNAGHMTHCEFLNLLAEAFGKKGPEKLISPLMAQIAILGETFRAFVSGSSPRINRRTFSIASEDLQYSSKKITETLGVTFISIEESVKSAVQIFKTVETL